MNEIKQIRESLIKVAITMNDLYTHGNFGKNEEQAEAYYLSAKTIFLEGIAALDRLEELTKGTEQ
jgi:hypothetical protein